MLKQEKQVAELKQREREVITHEQAHAAVGGQYAGQPQYEYTEGPDGKRYITGGEVSIDISKAETPEETIEKMQVSQYYEKNSGMQNKPASSILAV